MSNLSRDRILSQLNGVPQCFHVPLPNSGEFFSPKLNKEAKIEKLKTLMEAVRTEVHVVRAENWIELLIEIIKNKQFRELLYAPGTDIGMMLEERWKDNMNNLPELVPYDLNTEQFKPHLFDVGASITFTAGAIADSGAIILWPDENEPRSMSLIPPVHIAVLAAEKIYNSLSEVIHKEGWSTKMPTNAVLISGPSKTADIELTLAYGVHGPKELILMIIEN